MEEKNKRDAIDLFYMSMAETHKTLPEILQLELQMKVMKEVNEMKVRHLKEQHDDGRTAFREHASEPSSHPQAALGVNPSMSQQMADAADEFEQNWHASSYMLLE